MLSAPMEIIVIVIKIMAVKFGLAIGIGIGIADGFAISRPVAMEILAKFRSVQSHSESSSHSSNQRDRHTRRQHKRLLVDSDFALVCLVVCRRTHRQNERVGIAAAAAAALGVSESAFELKLKLKCVFVSVCVMAGRFGVGADWRRRLASLGNGGRSFARLRAISCAGRRSQAPLADDASHSSDSLVRPAF